MGGLFDQNGPLKITKTGPTDDDYIVGLRPEGSWGDIVDLLYIDQPVGAGFSFGNFYIDYMNYGSQEFIKFIRKFIVMYPEYKNNPIFFAAEGYGAKYMAHISEKVDRYNSNQYFNVIPWTPEDSIQINLDHILLFDPLIAPVRQRT